MNDFFVHIMSLSESVRLEVILVTHLRHDVDVGTITEALWQIAYDVFNPYAAARTE